MFNFNDALATEIKNKILKNFISAEIDIFYDKDLNEYFISTRDKELYNSDEYGKLIFEINQNILWMQGIFNFYFILDIRPSGFDKTTRNTTFFLKNETHYASWDVNNANSLPADNHIDSNNFSLAA